MFSQMAVLSVCLQRLKTIAASKNLLAGSAKPSALLYKIRPALRTVNADLPVPPGYAHLLSAVRALKDAVFPALRETEFDFPEIFRHIKPQAQINLILLVAFTHIF